MRAQSPPQPKDEELKTGALLQVLLRKPWVVSEPKGAKRAGWETNGKASLEFPERLVLANGANNPSKSCGPGLIRHAALSIAIQRADRPRGTATSPISPRTAETGNLHHRHYRIVPGAAGPADTTQLNRRIAPMPTPHLLRNRTAAWVSSGSQSPNLDATLSGRAWLASCDSARQQMCFCRMEAESAGADWRCT